MTPAPNPGLRALLDNSQTGAQALEELRIRCRSCHVTNPTICRETCQFWGIISMQADFKKGGSEDRDVPNVILVASDPYNRRIIQLLSNQPLRINELEKKGQGSKDHVRELVQAGLVRLDADTYLLTDMGRKVLEASSRFPIWAFRLGRSDWRVLITLFEGAKTFESLAKDIPVSELTRALERLKKRCLVTKLASRGRIIYFTTKRRPTRRLSPIEIKLFKAIPKTGITAAELSEKTGISISKTYRYLRRLRYKRHVTRMPQKHAFTLTPVGQQAAEYIRTIMHAIVSPSSMVDA